MLGRRPLRVGDQVRLGGVYRGFSPPAPGSEGVSPELSVNYEVGVRYMSRGLRAELIGNQSASPAPAPAPAPVPAAA